MDSADTQLEVLKKILDEHADLAVCYAMKEELSWSGCLLSELRTVPEKAGQRGSKELKRAASRR